MYAANSVAAGGDYATGYATSDKPLGFGMNAGASNAPSAQGANLVSDTNSAAGANTAAGFGRGRGGRGGGLGGGGGRRLFLHRLEILPDGALVAHSPTVTPQPYPSPRNTSK
jgi:hypothetical protein